MRRNPHLVQVRLLEQRLEERVGVRQPILRDDRRVGHKAVSPVQPREGSLATSFDEEERVGSRGDGVDCIHGC